MLTMEPRFRDAFKLRDELAAKGISEASADTVITAGAGGWFRRLDNEEQIVLIATMRSLALAKIELEKGAAEFRARFMADRASRDNKKP